MNLVKRLPPTEKIRRFAEAIAYAEGFGISGTVPTRANNPGDLKINGWTGEVTGDENIPIFSSVEDGWNRLYSQLEFIRDRRSHVYILNMTIQEMANHYTGTQKTEWAANVSGFLHVPVTTILNDLL